MKSDLTRIFHRRLKRQAPLTIGLLLLFSRAAHAIDIVRFELYKGESFTQTGTNSPALATNLPYAVRAVASPLYLPFVSATALQTPSGANHPLTATAQMDNGGIITNFVFSAAAVSLNALDVAYGAGNYTLTYTGMDDGPSSVVLALGADSFPPAPIISNLIAAQAINASSNFTLAFSSWLPADTNNLAQLTVLDNQSNVVFATPDIYSLDPRVLDGTNTSTLIQAGTLTNGQTYTGILTFTELTTNSLYDFTEYPIVLGGFFSETIFTLQTQSTGPTNTAPAATAPVSFADSFLTLTISNGAGPFAAAGTYEIFASPVGSNYTVLGPAMAGLASGDYAYSQTSTNTGVLAFSDAHAGAVSLQLTFNQAGTGTFALNSAAGTQSGAFTATLNYASLSPPLLFLPGLANGQFQAYLSGNLGVNYSIDASAGLSTWSSITNLTITTLGTNFYLFDSSSSAHRYYRARAFSTAFAPGSLNGLSFNCTVNGAASSLSTNGAFQWTAASNSATYQILTPSGALDGSGNYSYALTSPNTAAISYTDSSTGASYDEQLVFASAASGYFYITNAGSTAFQSGSFTMAQGPVLFLGSAKFTPDTARAASVDYLPTGTPVSLSVTDAAGYVWTLTIPGDALVAVTPRTITMTPFANLDSSASALPLLTGVQLGPEGLQFADGVTLTLNSPAPLGAHATLMMGNGDGSALYLVQTTNSASSYSTTLFHFSSGAASDPNDQQWQNYVNQNLPQAQAAYAQAQSQVQALERPVVVPPEPPDYEFKCSGNAADDQAVAAWQQSLFSQESAAIQNLLSAARALVLLTGDDSYADNAIPLGRQLIETAGYRKIDSLFANYSGNPLKMTPVAVAAFGMDRQDELLGGAGRPDWLTDVLNWMQGNVINYYWDKLRNGHDYSMATVLLGVQRQIELLGGGEDNFLSQLAAAYTFQVNLNISDIGGPDQYVAQWFTLTAQGMITITQDPNFVGPISGTNNVNYESGVYGDEQNDFLQLPLSFPEQIVMTLDACTNMTATVFVGTMGSEKETWNSPDITEVESYLSVDFDGAFYAQHNTDNYNVDYDCEYYFTVPLQNQQAQAVNQTFTGPGVFAPDDTVTFAITVQHTPK